MLWFIFMAMSLVVIIAFRIMVAISHHMRDLKRDRERIANEEKFVKKMIAEGLYNEDGTIRMKTDD